MRELGEYRRRLIDERLDEMSKDFPAIMVEGPRACGKTTTLRRRAKTVVRLDVPRQAAVFNADPDAALATLEEPVLIDEWQLSPDVLGAVKRSVDLNPRPGRFLLTGSAWSRSHLAYPGTGRVQRLRMYPMAVRETRKGLDLIGFFERVLDGTLSDPVDSPDLGGYVDLILRSGFPEPALHLPEKARPDWLTSYVTDLLTRDVDALDPGAVRKRDSSRLRTYFNAFALNTAGVTDHRSLFDKAGIQRRTAEAYEEILTELMVAELTPSWSANQLKRLVEQPKRYLIDAALAASTVGLDRTGIMRDGTSLGRLLETFVMAQLRAEASTSALRPTLHHLRTKAGRQEIDVIVEPADGRVLGIEVKADAAPGRDDGRHLAWLRDRLGNRFSRGLVLHTGPRIYELGDRITAVPISCLWS